MANSAYQNAIKRRRELREQVKELEKQLAEVERFIREYHRYSDTPPAEYASKRGPDTRSPAEIAALRKLAPNPPQEEIVKYVEQILEEGGRPLARGTLIKELSERGITLIGRDPTNVLGTLLFRRRDLFVNIPGYGYWIAKRPYIEAGYNPETWSQMQKVAVEKLRKRLPRT